MTAYLIADVEVVDAKEFDEYRKGVSATIAAYGGRFLARGGLTAVLEGDWVPKRLVVLEFPSMAVLEAWYESPEYRPLRDMRQRAARSEIVAVEGSGPRA
jgi:uncharacterized protein (DUF1330 family)